MIDALAYEPHFIDHLAPIWLALPARMRGEFLVDPHFVERAESLGIRATGRSAPKSIPSHPRPLHDGIPTLVASYGDIKKGRRMGHGPFVFVEHGIGQSYAGDQTTARHPSYSGGQDRDDVILNLVPNLHAAGRWAEHYPNTRTEVVGCPKLDSLPEREPGGGPVVAVSFHFPCSVSPETRSSDGEFFKAVEGLSQRYKVIGHAHPRHYGMDRAYRRARIEYVADFTDVCRRADLYVCDNSSTLYEFAATGRPVVVLNSRSYRKNVTHGLRFWDAADVGIQVDRPHDLIDAVDHALADPEEHQRSREAALDLVYAFRSGAAKRAAQAITEQLSMAVAA